MKLLQKPAHPYTSQYLMTLTHSTTAGKPLFHSVDRSPSFIDEGSNTVILTKVPKHQAEAAALASVLPALCQQKLHSSSYKWFSTDVVEHCEGVIFEPDSNKFQSHEDHLFNDMLEEDFGKTVMIKFDNLPLSLQHQKSTPNGKDNGSFVSFGSNNVRGKTHLPIPPPASHTTGTNSLLSPSFPTESANSHQAELITTTTAENESLHQQIQSLLLEKSQWQTSTHSNHPPHNNHRLPATSNTFNLPPEADA